MPLTIEEMHDVSCTEERGRVTSLVREMLVKGITAIDQRSAVAEVLADAGIPKGGSATLVNDSVLFLVGRDVVIGSKNAKDDAQVILKYEGGQSQSSGTNELKRGGDVSIAQITAYTDREGNEMVVSHLGRDQRVTLNVFSPQAAPWVETIESTNDPDGLAATWIGVVNSAPWRGKPKGAWIVARVTWSELNPGASTPLWVFRWQFQEASTSQGWLPIVSYIDNETNNMPLGLVVGEGIKSIPWYIEKDLNSKFD